MKGKRSHKTPRGYARAQRRAKQRAVEFEHTLDPDGACVVCQLDVTEWWHWRHMTYEGKSSLSGMPGCRRPEVA